MSFYEQVRSEVLRHGAINNIYLARFRGGDVNHDDFCAFAIEHLLHVQPAGSHVAEKDV